MAAPLTPNLTAAQEAALVLELNTYFNAMQVQAVLKCLSNAVGAANTTAATLATTAIPGVVKKTATQADFAGVDLAAVKVELNAWLVKLKAAGIQA